MGPVRQNDLDQQLSAGEIRKLGIEVFRFEIVQVTALEAFPQSGNIRVSITPPSGWSLAVAPVPGLGWTHGIDVFT